MKVGNGYKSEFKGAIEDRYSRISDRIAFNARAGFRVRPWYYGAMLAKRLTPILNVSNIRESFAWFEKLGWKKGWDWGDPPSFGGVCSGECEIFLCENGQGGRGKSDLKMTFGPESDEAAETGVWMSIWVDDVDAVYQHCVALGLEVTWPPTDEPWGVREMHVRHPDGHVFRISQARE